MTVVSKSLRSEMLSYDHWPSDTASNVASHTAEEDVLISETTLTVICDALGVMKSVDDWTHVGEAMALDGTDCEE